MDPKQKGTCQFSMRSCSEGALAGMLDTERGYLRAGMTQTPGLWCLVVQGGKAREGISEGWLVIGVRVMWHVADTDSRTVVPCGAGSKDEGRDERGGQRVIGVQGK